MSYDFWLGGATGCSVTLVLVWLRDFFGGVSSKLGEKIAEYEIRRIEQRDSEEGR